VTFSTGALLRAEVAAGTSIGKQVESIMKEGKLVPDDVVLNLVKQAIFNSPARRSGRKIVLDGFPRSLEQVKMFEREIGRPSCVVYLEASEEEMKKRVLERSKAAARNDDSELAFSNMLTNFKKSEIPIIDHFSAMGLVRRVSSIGSIREVYSKVEKVLLQISTVQFKPTVRFVVGGPGSGKGTICDLLSKEFGFVSINSGALIRSAVAQKTEVGRQVEKNGQKQRVGPRRLGDWTHRQGDARSRHEKDFCTRRFPPNPPASS